MQHKQTPEEERQIREAALDRTLAETFPASDPPSTLPNPNDKTALSEEAAPRDPGDNDPGTKSHARAPRSRRSRTRSSRH